MRKCATVHVAQTQDLHRFAHPRISFFGSCVGVGTFRDSRRGAYMKSKVFEALGIIIISVKSSKYHDFGTIHRIFIRIKLRNALE